MVSQMASGSTRGCDSADVFVVGAIIAKHYFQISMGVGNVYWMLLIQPVGCILSVCCDVGF